ncbi:MAG: hypothetical protein P8126_12180 [Gammaproteobacteria bacterium]|jgi:hypothetical protein
MNDIAVGEEITLESGEVDLRPDESGLRKITKELSQQHSRKNIKKLFRIYDKKILGVGEIIGERKRKYLVHLALLNHHPKHSFNINKTLFYSFLVFVSLFWITLFLKIHGLVILSDIYTYAAISLFAGIALLLFYKIVKSSRNSLIFYTAHGHIPLVEVLSRKPDSKHYKGFITELKKDISRFRKDERYSGQGLLSAELNEHRRLLESGIISGKEYELAKKNIFRRH